MNIATLFALLIGVTLVCANESFRAQKLVAMTFDDGPRPEILYGTARHNGADGLLQTLKRHNVHASFFVIGFKAHAYPQALKDMVRAGHTVENHTYGHGTFNAMAKRFGEQWIVNDIERASREIERITGRRPLFVRPPQWVIWPSIAQAITARGYKLSTLNNAAVRQPAGLDDVNTEDYVYAKANDKERAARRIVQSTLRQIASRERRGITTHILAMHELRVSVIAVDLLIPQLIARGYEIVPLTELVHAKTKTTAR